MRMLIGGKRLAEVSSREWSSPPWRFATLGTGPFAS